MEMSIVVNTCFRIKGRNVSLSDKDYYIGCGCSEWKQARDLLTRLERHPIGDIGPEQLWIVIQQEIDTDCPTDPNEPTTK